MRSETLSAVLRRAGLRDRHLMALRAMLVARKPTAIVAGRLLRVPGSPHRFGPAIFDDLVRRGLAVRTIDGLRPTRDGRAFVEAIPAPRGPGSRSRFAARLGA